MARFPVDPRIARMILAAETQGCLAEVLVIASVLSIQDPFERPRQRREEATRAREEFTDKRSDFLTYLNFWRHVHASGEQPSRRALRRLCKSHFVSWQRLREWQDVHRQLEETTRELGMQSNSEPADYAQIHRALLSGSLGLLGRWTAASDYDGARGSLFSISPACGLYRRKPVWMMAAELVETSRVYAHRGARIRPEWVEKMAPGFLLKRSYTEPHYDLDKGRVFATERVSIYGLPIVNRRRRPYDEVDTVECRKLFIAAALVEGRLRTSGDFLPHNQAVLGRLRDLEHKTRRTEMLEDDATIADLYAAKIPRDITRAGAFERWRKHIERERPTWLHFDEAELKKPDAPIVEQRDFPDFVRVDGHRFPLRYHFDPGDPDDGITVRIPLLLINQLPATAFDWLVPGRLREKILTLLRTLPKTWRRNFVPLPDIARHCHQKLSSNRSGPPRLSITEALARELDQLRGVRVPDDVWNIEKLPAHLLMNIEVVAPGQSVVGHGRNLKILRARFAASAAGGFEQLTPVGLRRDGLKGWPDVALPRSLRFQHGEFDLLGYPTIVDQGEAVGVRLLDTCERSRREGSAGVLRLMRLRLAKDLKTIKRSLPDIDRLELLYVPVVAALPIHCFTPRGHFAGPLRQQIMRVGIGHCFRDNPDAIRDQKSFERWVDEGRDALSPFLESLCVQLGEVLERHHDIKMRLRDIQPFGLDDNLEDLNTHLERLIFRGFLSVTPLSRLQSYPRYLTAVERRIDKLTAASRKDKRRSANLKRLWDRCQQTLNPLPVERREADDVQQIRWMMEELRVATFAQGLGTDQTISIERIETALAALVALTSES